MFCTECGRELSDTATFCTKCGHEVQTLSPSLPIRGVFVEGDAPRSTPKPMSDGDLPEGGTFKWKAVCPNLQCGQPWSYGDFSCNACYNFGTLYAYINSEEYTTATESPYADDYVEGVLELSPQLELRCAKCGARRGAVVCPVDGAAIFGHNLQACYAMPGRFVAEIKSILMGIIGFAAVIITYGLIFLIYERANYFFHRLAWRVTPKRSKWYPFVYPELRTRYMKKR